MGCPRCFLVVELINVSRKQHCVVCDEKSLIVILFSRRKCKYLLNWLTRKKEGYQKSSRRCVIKSVAWFKVERVEREWGIKQRHAPLCTYILVRSICFKGTVKWLPNLVFCSYVSFLMQLSTSLCHGKPCLNVIVGNHRTCRISFYFVNYHLVISQFSEKPVVLLS